jgi:hypothetical protein
MKKYFHSDGNLRASLWKFVHPLLPKKSEAVLFFFLIFAGLKKQTVIIIVFNYK